MDIKDKIRVMQAFANGLIIESKNKIKLTDWEECLTPTWNFEEFEYRVKPQQIRTYSIKELLDEIKIHGLVIKYKEKGYADSYYTIISFTNSCIGIIDAYDGETQNNSYEYYLNAGWCWADDESPIGVIENYEGM